MAFASEKQIVIKHAERGLTISGSRATLYDVMDLQKASYPFEFIRNVLNLTDEQLKVACDYIENNSSEVEAEYQEILATREEIHEYWEQRNRERFASMELMPRPLTKESLLSRLQSRAASVALS
ncbi:MAG: DUF433 domain-containing protein [Cyanobacteria bacterium P01_D01_bin.36]